MKNLTCLTNRGYQAVWCPRPLIVYSLYSCLFVWQAEYVLPSANCTWRASNSKTFCVGLFTLCNNFCSSVTWSDDLLKVHPNYAMSIRRRRKIKWLTEWDLFQFFQCVGLFALCNKFFLETWSAGLHKLHCNNDFSTLKQAFQDFIKRNKNS